jgi:hypothetical protein
LITLALLPTTTGPMRASGEADAPALVEGLKRAAEIELGFALLWTAGLVV